MTFKTCPLAKPPDPRHDQGHSESAVGLPEPGGDRDPGHPVMSQPKLVFPYDKRLPLKLANHNILWLYDVINSNHVDMEKLCNCGKQTCFFWGGLVLFAYSFSNRYLLQQPTKYPTFLAILRTRRSFAATLWPWLLFSSTCSSPKKHRKIHALWPKGRWFIQHVSSSHVFMFAMTHENLDISWHLQMSKKKTKRFKRIKLWLTISLSSRVLKKDPVSRNWCSASLLFHPSSSRPWLTSSLPSVTSKHWKKKRGITWKMSPRNKKNPTERQNVFTCIFYTFPPALPNSFPFPLKYFAQVTSGTSMMHSWIMAAFIRSWDGNLLGAIQLKSS